MQQNIYNELQTVFKLYDSFVIAIKGNWGTGKTFFWNKFKEENLKEKPYAYVSLFGKDSISDIKKDVIIQISVKDKHLSTVSEKIKDIKTTLGFKEDDSNFGLSGSLLSAAMSLFQKKEFKDVVICIDDFERKSSKLDIKDILGYLSQLKEQFGCQIVLILNEDKISNDDGTYKDYKEKIVDFEYTYNPSVEEAYKIIEIELLDFKIEFKEYCSKVNLNNIRIMKKIVRVLNRVSENIDFKQFTPLTKKTFLDKLFSILVINYKYSSNIRELSKYALSRRFDDEQNKEQIDTKKEEILSYVVYENILYHTDNIDTLILEFCNKSILNYQELNNQLLILNSKNEEINIENKFHELQHEMLYDLKIDKDAYVEKVFSFLEKNHSIIFRKTAFSNFMFYLNELKAIDSVNIQKYDQLLKDCVEKFIEEILSIDDNSYLEINDIYGKHIFDSFRDEKIPNIDSFIDDKLKDRKQNYGFDKLLLALSNIKKNRGYGNFEEEILNSISVPMYVEALQQTEILEKLYYLLRTYKNSTNIKDGINNIKEAIKIIEDKGDDVIKYQISRLKFITGIKIEESEENK